MKSLDADKKGGTSGGFSSAAASDASLPQLLQFTLDDGSGTGRAILKRTILFENIYMQESDVKAGLLLYNGKEIDKSEFVRTKMISDCGRCNQRRRLL